MPESKNQADRWKAAAEKLNDEFGGKRLMQCKLLTGRQFAVTPGELKACSSATHEKGTPTICTYDEPNVVPEEFLGGLAELIRANQLEDGPCVGCRHLVPTKVAKLFVTGHFSAISLHDFCGCNCHCVYCGGSEYFLPVEYEASQDHELLFSNLLEAGLIKPGKTRVDWGGGEPTLVNTFDRTVEFLSAHRILQTINTSGIRFSPQVEVALRERTAMVRVSVDRGTNETYLKVKRNGHCDAVWDTIERYAATGGNLVIKYIVFSMNSDTSEVEAFIDRCRGAGVRRICISLDGRYLWGTDSEVGELTEKELLAAATMYNLAKARHRHPCFETAIWQPEQLAEVGRLGGFDPYSKLDLAARAIRKARRVILGSA